MNKRISPTEIINTVKLFHAVTPLLRAQFRSLWQNYIREHTFVKDGLILI